jgi:hypothetical protein
MKIEFKAYNGKNVVYADNARIAAAGFLQRYKNRTFSIVELRNGSHCFSFPPRPDDYFSAHFKSRTEAQQFVDNTVNINEKQLDNSNAA